ncbi:hypothetical protein SAMN02745127_01540 [Oceanospirillum multiglobuliferum]|uniref:YeeE/YedE family protein n=1 Tax=Oceanospirillum multiglobuliferum TaxID=64969 RepID=A0A1T4PNP1_9GAMM|nr:YeeE/YedE thiosulfate transporter family protein [Oceanospirillum multiglobuliferum]OPX55397.1 YeeE/YedE family protein [Oceanospirillum multiglobuliferum]SJZ93153.1 hypothetical protein SAMN02745127_01540 [Oceanospirillum multiglobuliferum]
MEIVNFTPFTAFIGGGLIGLSAALLLLLNGRIAGISGIVSGVLLPKQGDWAWRLVFLLGLVLGGLLYQGLGLQPELTEIKAAVAPQWLALAGFLVGVGTMIGTGCTSGHGICGLAHGSLRSLVATLSFMTSAAVTVWLVRHLFGG